jgi:hypothetical protein
MAITKQSIIDAYNSVYAIDNGRDKVYDELDDSEKIEALLIINGNSSGGGSGGSGDATNAGIKTAIETATNISDVDAILVAITSSINETSGSLAVLTDTIGLNDDLTASSDTGISTLTGLIKRLLSVKLPDLIDNQLPVNLSSDNSDLFELVDTIVLQNVIENEVVISIPSNSNFYLFEVNTNLEINGYGTNVSHTIYDTNSPTFFFYPINIYDILTKNFTGDSYFPYYELGYFIVSTDAPILEFYSHLPFTGSVTDTVKIYKANNKFISNLINFKILETSNQQTAILGGINSSNLAISNNLKNTFNGDSGTVIGRLMEVNNKLPSLTTDNKIPVNPSVSFTISRSSGGTGTALLPGIDVTNYSLITVQITGTFVASIEIKGGNVNNTTTQRVIPVINVETGDRITTITAPGLYLVPKTFQHISCSPSSYSSGSITADWLFSNTSVSVPATQDVQLKNATIKSGNILSNPTTDTALVTTVRDPIFSPKKITITGFLSIAATNNNLLDGSGSGAVTDVRDYQSGKLYIFSTATSGNYSVQGTFDVNFSNGVHAIPLFETIVQNANPITTPITVTSSTRVFDINLQGINYLKIALNTATAGIRAFLVLNQAPFVPNSLLVQQLITSAFQATVSQPTAGNLNMTASQLSPGNLQSLVSISAPGLTTDITSSILTTSSNSTTITPGIGCSYSINLTVSSVSGTNPTLVVDIQESDNSGVNWFTVYTFPVITSAGIYRSPQIQLRGNRIRYVQTVAGSTPSFTRTISRLPVHASVPIFKQQNPLIINGSITTGGTAQTALAANPSRIFLHIQNNSIEDLWIDFDDIAGLNAGIRIVAGSSERFETRLCPIGAVSIFGATTSQTYVIVEG